MDVLVFYFVEYLLEVSVVSIGEWLCGLLDLWVGVFRWDFE